MVPDGGQISFGEIAEQIGVPEHIVQRMLRFAMTMHIFREPNPGFVAHTKTSKAMTNAKMADWNGWGVEGMWPSTFRVSSSIIK